MATAHIYIDEGQMVRRHDQKFLSGPYETLAADLEQLGATEIMVHKVPSYVSFFYYDEAALRKIEAYVDEHKFLRLEKTKEESGDSSW